MDPDAALADLRELAKAPIPDGDAYGHADALATRFENLDEWITKGGFLPKVWQRPLVAAGKVVEDLTDPVELARHADEAAKEIITALSQLSTDQAAELVRKDACIDRALAGLVAFVAGEPELADEIATLQEALRTGQYGPPEEGSDGARS